eukprot:GHVQ01007623.1.p1 GENE.GHVQ01007623.1~~GHVQ01007623.1.p1  ORF type:complete len:220 (+),score=55.78 GHVQ01007623.1:218-877(+)
MKFCSSSSCLLMCLLVAASYDLVMSQSPMEFAAPQPPKVYEAPHPAAYSVDEQLPVYDEYYNAEAVEAFVPAGYPIDEAVYAVNEAVPAYPTDNRSIKKLTKTLAPVLLGGVPLLSSALMALIPFFMTGKLIKKLPPVFPTSSSTAAPTGTGSTTTGGTTGTGSTVATTGTGSTVATTGTGSTVATTGTGSTVATTGTGSTVPTTGTTTAAVTTSTSST